MEGLTLIYYFISLAWYTIFIGMIIYLYYKRSKEYIPEFKEKYYEEVPSQLNPGELSTLLYRKITPETFTSTILILIKKEVLTLKHTEKDYYIWRNTSNQTKLSNSQKYLIEFLIDNIGDKEKVSFTALDKYCNSHNGCSYFLMNYQIWLRMMRKEATKKKFYEEKTEYSKVKMIQYLGIGLFIVNILGSYHLPLGYFMIVPSFFVSFYFYRIYKRTITVNEEYHKWLAFKQYLEDIDKFKFNKQDTDTYLIYSVLLKVKGLENKITKYNYIDNLNEIVNHSIIQATLRGNRNLFTK